MVARRLPSSAAERAFDALCPRTAAPTWSAAQRFTTTESGEPMHGVGFAPTFPGPPRSLTPGLTPYGPSDPLVPLEAPAPPTWFRPPGYVPDVFLLSHVGPPAWPPSVPRVLLPDARYGTPPRQGSLHRPTAQLGAQRTNEREALFLSRQDLPMSPSNPSTPQQRLPVKTCGDMQLHRGRPSQQAEEVRRATAVLTADRAATVLTETTTWVGGNVRTQAMEAARSGHAVRLQWLVLHGANLGAVDNDGNSLVLLAAKGGHWDCVALLHNAGAVLTRSNHDGYTVAMFAARDGKRPWLALLRDIGDDLHRATTASAFHKGYTALHFAARGGHRECLELMCRAAVNLNAATAGGATATMIAIANQHDECVALLRSIATGSGEQGGLASRGCRYVGC